MPKPSEVDLYFARIKTDDIYPPFLTKCRSLIGNLADRKVYFYGTSGFRSVEHQDELYQKGRRNIPGESKVTNAKGGSSAHNYGCAIDFCRDGDVSKTGLQPVWKTSEYKVLADEAVNLGLEAGYYWKSITDGPHIQLPLTGRGIKLIDLKTIYDKGGLKAVWQHLDKFTW